jgi:phospholipid N-methyltransferase
MIIKAFKNLRTLGSVAPSSPHLIKKMLADIDFSKEEIIVEFGIGDGCFTEEILKRLSPKGKLICFEIDKEFCQAAREKFKDDRFVMIEGGAETLTEVLAEHKLTEVDCVISSLPLAILPKKLVTSVLTQSKKFLKKDGMYLQYQYSLASFKEIKKYFSSVKRKIEVLNIPPAVVYTCRH